MNDIFNPKPFDTDRRSISYDIFHPKPFDRPTQEVRESTNWYCSGCGQTDRNKRCMGCRTP